jgi:hypothetical protein
MSFPDLSSSVINIPGLKHGNSTRIDDKFLNRAKKKFKSYQDQRYTMHTSNMLRIAAASCRAVPMAKLIADQTDGFLM